MRYFANPCGSAVSDAMRAGHLGLIDTPYQGRTGETRRLRAQGVEWCADNGAFSDRWDQATWWAWLSRLSAHAPTAAFAVAPDVVGDAAATLERATPWLPRIRGLGYAAAYVAQNGVEADLLPWSDFDVLFIGGCRECRTHGPVAQPVKVGVGSGSAARYVCPHCALPVPEWKLGPVPRTLTAEAVRRGKRVHMGRVNSRKRFQYARRIGCSSVDGTFLTNGPERRLPELLEWVGALQVQPELF